MSLKLKCQLNCNVTKTENTKTEMLYPLANTEILAPELVGDHSKILA